jgi:hypothetical protein
MSRWLYHTCARRICCRKIVNDESLRKLQAQPPEAAGVASEVGRYVSPECANRMIGDSYAAR